MDGAYSVVLQVCEPASGDFLGAPTRLPSASGGSLQPHPSYMCRMAREGRPYELSSQWQATTVKLCHNAMMSVREASTKLPTTVCSAIL
jgi:hypothetical protein